MTDKDIHFKVTLKEAISNGIKDTSAMKGFDLIQAKREVDETIKRLRENIALHNPLLLWYINENAALRSAMQYLMDNGGVDCCAKCIYCPHPTSEDDDCDCQHKGECVDGMIKWFERPCKEL